MRIGIFIPTYKRNYDKLQSALWIRALQMVDPLRALGVDVSVNNYFRHYDIAIYHRGMREYSVRVVRYLKRISNKVVWDTCVDYFDRHEAADETQVGCAREIAAIADGVCVPCKGIADNATRFNGNVFIMPDPINLEYFQPQKDSINWNYPVFGWSGVSSKAFSLDDYSTYLDARLHIISDTPPPLKCKYSYAKWTHASFVSELLKCDVAFLPRHLESTYTVNNSSFKALVFASLGIPVIANALPSYKELAKHYNAIAFLEDFGGSPDLAVESLMNTQRDASDVRRAYDRRLWAERLVKWCHVL